MKHLRFNRSVTVFTALTLSGLLISCTKELPYEYTYKGEGVAKEQDKGLISKDEYVMVASSDRANQDSTGAAEAMPYWQGDGKIVKMRFNKDSLQIVQVYDETRLQDNSTNEKVVMEIPVTHIDYACAKDRYGKCTNKEEQSSDLPWDKKTKFLPDFNGMKTVGFNMVPVEMEKVFGTSCFNETASEFLGYELTAESLNIQVQKAFTGDIECLEKAGLMISSLDDLQAQIIYHYSFTKLDKLASPGYQAVVYPQGDESTFGFFTTEKREYDVDFNRTERSKTQFLNRWNPARKEIVYYMTDNFNKPEMKSIKTATEEAFAQVNKGLEAAGIETRLVLKDPAGKAPGDARNNMIVMVEDPIAGGPLGYGPSVANPRTGEIISARTAMYYGNYLQNIKTSYDEVVRELRAEKFAALAPKAKTETSAVPQAANASSKAISSRIAKTVAANYNNLKGNSSFTPRVNDIHLAGRDSTAMLGQKDFAKSLLVSDKASVGATAIGAMSKHCNYPAELFPFNEIIRGALQSKLGTELKPWLQLSDAEKKAVLDILLPEVWRPTLVHELGHNLGLRHNFGGSEDKDNFYKKDELHAMGVTHAIPYSSVMDYGYSELNLLPTLGKYDIAALRFAYKREVETTDGKVLSIPTTLVNIKKELPTGEGAVGLKDYQYCSDEHVDVNPNCKRFDSGSTMTEIVDHLIKSYDDMYTIRNTRNGRESFSNMGTAGYYGATWARFKHIRAFMERYESIKARFKIPDDAKEWETVEWLKDTKTAALKSGRFFIKVMHTPDLTCAIAKTEKPEEVVIVERLEAFDKEAFNCFDAKLNDKFVVVGQAGKAFNDRKDPASDNAYADQIDVRGIWPDKIAATRALLNRRVGNSLFDQHEDNYVDMKDLSEEVPTAIMAMLMNQVETDMLFKTAEGRPVLKGELFRTNVFSTPASMKTELPTHWIPAPMSSEIAKQIGVPMQQTSFQEVLLKIVADGMKTSQSHRNESQSFLNALSVVRTSKAHQINEKSGGKVKDFGALRLVALPENSLAHTAIMINDLVTLMDELKPEEIEALIAEKESGAKTSKFPAKYKDLPVNALKAYRLENLPKSDVLEYLLTLLPMAN